MKEIIKQYKRQIRLNVVKNCGGFRRFLRLLRNDYCSTFYYNLKGSYKLPRRRYYGHLKECYKAMKKHYYEQTFDGIKKDRYLLAVDVNNLIVKAKKRRNKKK